MINLRKKAVLLLPLFVSNIQASPLEVLHWWTAPGELESQQILQKTLLKKHIQWKNFAIVGEGGEGAIRVLQMRALSGNPPDAAQIKGPDINEWARVGMIEKIDKIIDSSSWQTILPKVVRDTVIFKNHYMAVPVDIHRVNWLWLNKKIFDQLQLPVPTTWDSFFVVADKIKAAGYLPLAHGGTVWQDALLFESIALSLLGAERYRKAFIRHDADVLNSEQMLTVFKMFKRLHVYTDKSLVGKDWNSASQLIADDKAAMQFMGDWAKGVWNAAGKIAMQDYICVDVPQSKGLFSYNIDSFVLFTKYNYKSHNSVQIEFAKTLLSREFQIEFNLAKGSIPIRNDIDISLFDACSQKSYRDFQSSELVPSFTQNMASSSNLQMIMSKIISNYFNDPQADAQTAVQHLSLSIRAVK